MYGTDRSRVRTARSRPMRSLALAVPVVVVVLVASSCGSDDDASTTTAKQRPVTSPVPTTSTTSTTVVGTHRGSIELRIGSRTVSLTSESCTTATPTSIKLTATDGSGNTLTVDATDGTGSAIFRGPSEDREGTVKSVQVGGDGTFSAAGIMSVADDSAPAPDDLSVTGLCA